MSIPDGPLTYDNGTLYGPDGKALTRQQAIALARKEAPDA